MDLWAYKRGVVLDFSRPAKASDNAFIEAFNGRFRTECLSAHWYLTLTDATEKLEAWRRYYNEEWPHGAIGVCHQPITLREAGKLQLQTVQFAGSGSEAAARFIWLGKR